MLPVTFQILESYNYYREVIFSYIKISCNELLKTSCAMCLNVPSREWEIRWWICQYAILICVLSHHNGNGLEDNGRKQDHISTFCESSDHIYKLTNRTSDWKVFWVQITMLKNTRIMTYFGCDPAVSVYMALLDIWSKVLSLIPVECWFIVLLNQKIWAHPSLRCSWNYHLVD